MDLRVFSTVLVAAVMGLGVKLFVLIFVYNLVETVIAHSVHLYRAKKRQTTVSEVGSSKS